MNKNHENSETDMAQPVAEPDVTRQPMAVAVSAEPPPAMPGESARDYAGFLEYCRLGSRVPDHIIAEKMGVRRPRLSQIKRRWKWEQRIIAHQDKSDLPELTEEWRARREDTREREWDVHLETMHAAEEALERWRNSDKIPSFGDIAKMIELWCGRWGEKSSGDPRIAKAHGQTDNRRAFASAKRRIGCLFRTSSVHS